MHMYFKNLVNESSLSLSSKSKNSHLDEGGENHVEFYIVYYYVQHLFSKFLALPLDTPPEIPSFAIDIGCII